MSDPGWTRAAWSRPEPSVWGVAKFARLRRGGRAHGRLLGAAALWGK